MPPVYPQMATDQQCIDTIRVLSADVVQGANSGHPGAPMGCAPMAHVLWSNVMRYAPSQPDWINRARFVLSNGHACALQYIMLHLTGYDLSVDDLKAFRKIESKTPGHPENFATAGVEVATGPLGQGLSNAVGLAMSESPSVGIQYDTDDEYGGWALSVTAPLQEVGASKAKIHRKLSF